MLCGRGRPSNVAGTLVVHGFKELEQATAYLIPSEKLTVREALEKVGEIVRLDGSRALIQYKTGGAARSAAESINAAKSAAGFKVRIRQRGVEVEQSLRKTTGLHPEWGGVQMKHALLPALYGTEPAWMAEFDKALDTVVATFNR